MWAVHYPFTPRERIERRGYCTGPFDGEPLRNDALPDNKVPCCTCGRLVAVTTRGRYANHKAPVESQRTAAEALLPKLTTRQICSLRRYAANGSWDRIHGHTIHSLEDRGLIAREGRRITPLGYAVLAADNNRIPNLFDDLFPAAEEARP